MHNIYDFNYDWQFFPHKEDGIKNMRFSRQGERVVIPHAPRMEALDVTKPFSGVMYYRKLFKVPSELASKRLFIDFEGVMTKATVYVNGAKLATHYGGYLPFSVDITSHVKMNSNNLIVVEVDNRDNSNIPPGKPTSKVDFLYYGGIYRGVTLRAVDKVYIDEPTEKKTFGGIFAYTARVDGDSAYEGIAVNVVNSYFKKLRIYVRCTILDADGFKVTEAQSCPMMVAEGKSEKFEGKVLINNPILWDIDNPYLYTLHTEVYANDELADVVDTTIGIRTVSVDQEGFHLNGKLVRLNGANRHQQYPYIGIAGGDRLDYRDIAKLKEAGFNSIRLSHYPQSKGVMDACDRLGMIAIIPVPGWQFCKAGMFKRRLISNVREMVRKDRNHASAIIWEASPNETGFWWLGATDTFFEKLVSTVRSEYAPASAIVCGDTIGRKNWKKIGYDIPFTGWDNEHKLRTLDSDVKGLTREYGDYEFGGHNSTTRVRLQDGEMAMRAQAFNFQWSHNMNIGSKYELGDLIWEGIDHNRGMGDNKPVSTSGILNEWRLPKFSYYFYKSQRSDEDMVYIPTFWDGATNGRMTIFSNADEVELYINDELIGRHRPNSGTTELFDMKFFDGDQSVDYWRAGGEYDINNSSFDLARYVMSRLDGGANGINLQHPPFTFSGIQYSDGKIEARAIKDGRVVAIHSVMTPKNTTHITVDVDYMDMRLANDGRDKVFVRAYARDENETIVKCECGEVTFEAEGGRILGSSSAVFETGIASALLVSDIGADKVVVRAHYGDMTSEIEVELDKVDIKNKL